MGDGGFNILIFKLLPETTMVNSMMLLFLEFVSELLNDVIFLG